jgi:hypothetical protein
MTMKNAYPMASEAARQIHERFAEHVAAARAEASGLLPTPAVIESLLDAAFWASLKREENHVALISLAFAPAKAAGHALVFEKPVELTPANLARLSPAVERPGIHLGVWDDGAGLQVWGTTREVPRAGLVLEVVAPGVLVVKHRRLDGEGKFVNVAVLEGDRARLLDHHPARLAHCPVLLSSLMGFESPSAWVESANVLVQLAVSMRNHRRGGTLLVVPAGSQAWRDSIIQPVSYAIAPAYDELHRLLDPEERESDQEVTRAVDAIAGLTAVDGATIITDRYEVVAFGAKIRRRGAESLERVCLLEPVTGSESTIVSPNQLGGTRHMSAAQFVQDQPDAVGLVASQDGEFTIFLWSPEDRLVHAHRITVFLL